MAVLLYLVVSVTAVNQVLGVSLNLSGSSSYAVLNQPFTLTCTVTQAAGLSDIIAFIKESTGGTVASMQQNTDKCSEFNVPPGYTVFCGSGTGSSSSTTKKYSVKINRTTVIDAIVWRCKLKRAKESSNTFQLQLSSGPDSVTFSPPLPGSVAEGDSLTVMCAASCNPPCSYSWTQRHQLISPASLLKLTNINRSQTGNVYTCTATNSLIPKSKIKQFTLTVYYGPDNVQLNTTSPLTVKEGDDVAVSCGATNCSPSCSFTWKFKSQSKSTSSVLSLNNIQRSAAGDYTCTARNTNTQKSLDKTITLEVQYQSSITSLTLNSQSASVTVDELTAMTLKCDVDSNPGSHIKILNNSQTLREMTNSRQAEYTWDEAGCLDTGHYTCDAGNNIKSAVSESVQLAVRCSPRLDHRVPFQKQFAAAVGGDVTLKISVIANPTPTFTWYKLTDGNKNRLGSGSSSTADVSGVGNLTLANVQQGDIGTYQIVVSDGAKNANLVVNLTLDVAGPPNTPSNVTAWANGPHTIAVSWIEGFNGGSKQIFLVQYRTDRTQLWTNLTEEFPEKGLHTNHTAVILNLEPNMRYLVRVLAYNTYGYTYFTNEQEALTLPSCECRLPTSSNEVTGKGIAVGIVIGIAISTLAVTVFVILWRRGFVCASPKPDVKRTQTSVHQHTSLEDTRRGNSNDLGLSNDQTNTYEGLEVREATPYAKLELYENLKT